MQRCRLVMAFPGHTYFFAFSLYLSPTLCVRAVKARVRLQCATSTDPLLLQNPMYLFFFSGGGGGGNTCFLLHFHNCMNYFWTIP